MPRLAKHAPVAPWVAALAALLFWAPQAHAATSSASVFSPMGGNGHNVTFDGRLFIVTQGNGWNVMLLRPERITYDGAGFPNVNAGAFTAPVLIQPTVSTENANAICESNALGTPFRCDAGGAYSAAGAYECYDVWVFDSDALSALKEMRRRNLLVVVGNPKTADAYVHTYQWRTGMEPVFTVSDRMRGIEPTVTQDGKLMVWQGTPSNDGNIDLLVYAYNPNPCAASGWSGPFSISHLYYDANTRGRYRLAEKPLRATDGTYFYDHELVRGAYPWLFPEGDAVIFTATVMPCYPENGVGCGARRNALSVLGYPTNWFVAHIDGGVNPSTTNYVRLFFSSPGASTFSQIPVTQGTDVWPFFGSNTSNYAEIIFDDGLDGNYRGVWLMNESIDKNGNFDLSRTPDTSGYANTGVLVSAGFPNANSGPVGKVVEFNGSSSWVEVAPSSTLNPVNALSVEALAAPYSAADCNVEDNRRALVAKGSGLASGTSSAYGLAVLDGQRHSGWVVAGGARLGVEAPYASMPAGSFSKALLTYEAPTGFLRLFVNDALVAMSFGTPGATLTNNAAPLYLGGVGYARPACPAGEGAFHGAIDEVRLSSVARRPRRANDAVFVSQSLPSPLYVRHPATATVTLRNVGTTTWRASTLHRLGSQSPQDNGLWGAGRIELPNDVAPGSEVTVSIPVTPPTTPGVYPMQWRMVQDAVEWFGDVTRPDPIAVMVRPNDAVFVSQDVPATLVAGQSFTATFTVRNVGSTTWSAAQSYALGSQSPQDSGTFGAGRIALSGDVAPGATAVFTLTGTAPSTPGSYPMHWRMVQDGVEWFGDTTAATPVGVSLGCVIAGVPYANGAAHPASACSRCDAGLSTTAWSARAPGESCGASLVCTAAGTCQSGCYIAGAFYANGVTNPANPCQVCAAAISTSTWATQPVGASCGGGLVCSAAAQCTSACFIDGSYVALGTRNALNACEVCAPATSATSWTARATGASCGDGLICSASAACTSACFIGGAIVAAGAQHPSNVCQGCEPSLTTTAWSNDPVGTQCGNARLCSSVGSCEVTCLIDGTLYASGQSPASDPCRSCEPSQSATSWTARPAGASCGLAHTCDPAGACERVALAARIVAVAGPTSVEANAVFGVTVTVENLGSDAWSNVTQDALGLLPAGTFGLSSVPVPRKISTLEQVTFEVSARAPSLSGAYSLSFGMLRGSTPFGEVSHAVELEVLPAAHDGRVLEVSAPVQVAPGEVFLVELRLLNAGTTAWTPGSHRLAALSDEWLPRAVLLPQTVQPGDELSLAFEATAPSLAGLQTVRWQMSRMEGPHFGEVAAAEVEVLDTVLRPGDNVVAGGCASAPGQGLGVLAAFCALLTRRCRRRSS